jgi:flagellar biogenesis protein FliO
MRHNQTILNIAPGKRNPFRGRIVYTLSALLILFSVNAVYSKPESNRTKKNENKTEVSSRKNTSLSQQESSEKTLDKTSDAKSETAVSETTDKESANAVSKEISDSWMSTIHGNKTAIPASQEGAQSDSLFSSGKSGDKNDKTDTDGREIFTPENQVEPPSFLSVLVKFILLMGALAGGLYFVARYIKQKQGIPLSGENNLLKVIVSLPLMPGKYLQVVELAGQLMVLGVSESGVHLVSRIDDGPTADRIRMWRDSKAADRTAPSGVMDAVLSALSGKNFHFWKHENRSSPAVNPANISFADLLAGNPERDTSFTDNGTDLNSLLSQQKRRLAALKKKNTIQNEEDDR